MTASPTWFARRYARTNHCSEPPQAGKYFNALSHRGKRDSERSPAHAGPRRPYLDCGATVAASDPDVRVDGTAIPGLPSPAHAPKPVCGHVPCCSRLPCLSPGRLSPLTRSHLCAEGEACPTHL